MAAACLPDRCRRPVAKAIWFTLTITQPIAGNVTRSGSHFSESTGGITGGGSQFTFALGGGLDIGLRSAQRFALRPKLKYVGIRSAGSTTPAARLAVGIVYRIGQK